jgi:hypothetical protein
MFRFTPAQISQMRETLQRRIPLLAELLPFDDPNYGLDESWATLHPYWTTIRSGQTVKLALRITNHSPGERTFRASIHTPSGFRCSTIKASRIAAHADGRMEMTVEVPRDVRAGLHVLTADLSWEGTDLREWAEAILELAP